MTLNQRRRRGERHEVTVIGAGWSGLLCTKYMLEEGLSVATLEKRDDLGGVWYYSDDPSINTVMKSTFATSSRTVTEMSDFPMPTDKGYFLHHSDMLQYLHSYADKFNLLSSIHFNTDVERVEKKDDLWHVHTARGNVYVSKYLVVATGSVDKRNYLNKEVGENIFKDFTGTIYHAGEIKEPKQEHKGCRLLIYGGGETASDLCSEWHEHSSIIYWSIPRGQHFFRKYTKILPWRDPQVLDKVSSRMITTIAPYHYSKPGLAWICKWTTNGSMLAYQGHGIPEWKNDSEFMHFFVNKNGKVLDLVDYKKVVPKANLQKCEKKRVTFSDGEEHEFDVIILSTGYAQQHSFLGEQQSKITHQNRFKYVFDNKDPSIAFVGFVRPVVGSIPVVAEVQARWVAKVFSGHVHLPSQGQREAKIKKDNAFWDEYFKKSSRRMEQLVEGYIYIDEIAKEAGIYPNFYSLFRQNIRHWYISVVAPFNSSVYRLNEPEFRDEAIARLQSHRQHTITPVHLMLILFLWLIWFDWILNQLEKMKYKAQTSALGKQLANTPPVQFINRIWCIPKTILFDKNTYV